MTRDAGSLPAGDLTKTGMVLTHDREWAYELDRIKAEVRDQNASIVGLQFPEGLKRRAPGVADDLREQLGDGVTVIISGQPCYGACDLDTELMRRTDVFVHFGHSPMKESDRIIYVPLVSNVDPFPIMEAALEELPNPDDTAEIGLVTTAQHHDRFPEMTSWLESRGFDVQTRRGDDRLTHEGQVLGCNYESARVSAETILYVGGGKFHPLGLAMEHRDKQVVIADPVNNIVEIADADAFIKQRYGTIHRAMDAKTWGVIFCTKIGQGRWDVATEIIENNQNAYLITLDEITPDRLLNFRLDAFVNTGCPRITTDDGPQFDRPLLTPDEYEIAIGNKPLDALSFDTFHGTW